MEERRRVTRARSETEMQRSKITSSLRIGKSGLYNENKSIRLMKIAVILLEKKRKKTSPIMISELEKKWEKTGETTDHCHGKEVVWEKVLGKDFLNKCLVKLYK